ncbi:MAG: hypothetical protein V3U92_15135 [Cellulophaga sp.]
MKFQYVLFLSLFCFHMLNNDIQRKIISDKDYNYVFYVSIEELSSYKVYKEYFWYKSGEVHSSIGSSFGDVLHGVYTKSYLNKNIAEQGSYKKGLKDNLWKKWHTNGMLDETVNWNEGLRSGTYSQYTENGKILQVGKYKNNRKHGEWINKQTADTLYFDTGAEIKKPVKKNALKGKKEKNFKNKIKTFFGRLFSKKGKKRKVKKKRKNKKDKKGKKN